MQNKIYIYQTPFGKKNGLIKIGQATNVDERIQNQVNQASAIDHQQLTFDILYHTPAYHLDGRAFKDHDIHSALIEKGYRKISIRSPQSDIVLKSNTEWFDITLEKAISLIEQYKNGIPVEKIEIDRTNTFGMRPEQQEAVNQSISFFKSRKPEEPKRMLWNAKMRFGKTFTSYQLALAMNLKKIVVITYKPAVESAWKEDLEGHKDFADYTFISKDRLSTIRQYTDRGEPIVAFASYQDMLGSGEHIKEKHEGLFSTEWDMVIVDEFHYGTGTAKAQGLLSENEASTDEIEVVDIEEKLSQKVEEVAEKSLQSTFMLYLSGTPFKALADDKFEHEAIYNWTYSDEQKAKEEWNKNNPDNRDNNPYSSLPEINMYLYKVSSDLIDIGTKEGKDEFSLNHFFKAENGTFERPEAVNKWLNIISGVIRPDECLEEEVYDNTSIQTSQYPFDHESNLSNEVNHTLWYLSRVDSAIALKDALEKHVVFKNYKVILAAGVALSSGSDAVKPVKDMIDNNEKTITLTVGKLTTGVSIPKWKGVLFLRDTDSAENYFQTAFRAQTPHLDRNGNVLKKTCYIFDFSPNRALKLLTSYSEKLSKDSHKTSSEKKISEFIRYLPVLRVQGNEMIEMDARDVLTFDLSGVDAKGLGSRFMDRKNVVVSRDVIDAMNSSAATMSRCQAIFDKIKKFKKLTGATSKEMEEADVQIKNLDNNDQKIKKLKTKKSLSDKDKREEKKAEKDIKSEQDKIRELLRTLLSRLPIFMYMTDATEESLEHILIETEQDLFRKTTGITVDEFHYLKDVGLIKIDSIDGYILRFIQLENANFETSNRMLNA